MPRVAILVACYDDGATIRETVASLRPEPATELVIVDDGSSDPETLDALAEIEREGVRVMSQENAGPSAAWMTGLRATSAPYVMPFSADDVLVSGATARLAAGLEAVPEAAVAWGDMRSFGAAHADIPSAPALCPWHVTYTNARPAYALFRRDRLLEVGGWQLRHGIEDWDLWMRLAAHGMIGVHVPAVTFHYRRDSGGRFRGHVLEFARLYDELHSRNSELFARRDANRLTSPAPRAVKVLLPIIDRLPFASRLLKVQLCDLVTQLFWSAGLRRTALLLLHGLLFRIRVRVSRRAGP